MVARVLQALLFGVLVLAAGFGAVRLFSSLPMVPESPPFCGGKRLRVVEAGETLWAIASEELGDGARWRELAALNGIADPTALRVGQTLVLP